METKKLKSVGEMQEPWGTPTCKCLYGDSVLLYRQPGLASWVFTQGKIPRYLPGKKGEKDFEVFPP